MNRFTKTILPVLAMAMVIPFLATVTLAQYVPIVPPQNTAVPTALPNVGSVTTSGLTATVLPGSVYCNGSQAQVAPTSFTLLANSIYYLAYNCLNDQLYVRTMAAPQGTDLLLAVLTTAASTIAVTDTRSTVMFVNPNDGAFFIPASACGGGVSGTAGAGNATDIVALAGGMRVFRLSNTAAGPSTNTFTCTFQVPTRLTTNRGVIINDLTLLVSTQTTQPTSVTTSTLKSSTAPAAVDPETASSATFVNQGGVVTMVPTSGQFAAYAAVAAGQFYSLKASLAAPISVITDLQTFIVTFTFAQAGSAAGIQEIPGFYVHYTVI